MSPFGLALRDARQRRGVSQLDLALRVRSTARHVSFLETGRSRPSAEMVLRLARGLDLPLRQRNALLRTAGFAPAFPERPLDDAALGPVRHVIDRLLAAHEPFPAYVVDARWRFVRGNRGGAWLWRALGVEAGVDNVLLALFDGPAAAWLDNHDEVVCAVYDALVRDVAATGDPGLADDLARLARHLPASPPPPGTAAVVAPRLRMGDLSLSLLTTVCRLGNAVDVTLDELRVELVFPADAASEAALRALAS